MTSIRRRCHRHGSIHKSADSAYFGRRPSTAWITLNAVECDLVEKALVRAGNNKSQAAKLLGVPRGQFYSLLKRHGLTDARR